MTLDEAIIHFKKKAEEQMQRIDNLSDIPRFGSSEEDIKLIEKCEKCAEEYRLLAEWLRDYKRLKEQITKITDIVDGTIDHFDRDDAMDMLYEIKGVIK